MTMTRRRMLAKGGAAALRGLALASRFLFIVTAAFFMTPEAFGIYGLIAASSFVIVQLAGIEAHAVVMRRVAVTLAGSARDDRPFYGRFVILSSAFAFGGGVSLGLAFGWPAPITLLAGAIVALEYAGVEATRILAAEKRPTLALCTASLRVVPWALGIPALGALGGLDAWWSLEVVLSAWAVCGAAALAMLAPVRARYARPLPGSFSGWYGTILRRAPRWVVIALAPRFLESGVRIVPGAMLGEAEVGRFVFLATLAGIGPIAVRAVVEPYYFAAMLDPATGRAARQGFARATLGVIALGTLASVGGWWAATGPGGKDLGDNSLPTLFALVAAAIATSLAQVAHYGLYAGQRDAEIFSASLATLLAGVPLVAVLTAVHGTLGTAIGTALAAVLLLVLKSRRAAMPPPARARFQTW